MTDEGLLRVFVWNILVANTRRHLALAERHVMASGITIAPAMRCGPFGRGPFYPSEENSAVRPAKLLIVLSVTFV
jgi:hypothetical protein